jgi:hypothetical protein
MNKALTPLAAVLSFACFIGCQSPPAGPTARGTPGIALRNNCYSLLHQLMDEEKDVSVLRFIKREHPDLKSLINQIAQTSDADAKLLEQCATNDPSIRLDEIQLPPGEVATRSAISSTKEKALLEHSGDKFELNLLLTQIEAVNYAWHLAKVAGENEPNPARARMLEGISKDMENLYNELCSWVAERTQ